MFHHQTDKRFVQYNGIIVPTRSSRISPSRELTQNQANSAILKYLKFSKVPQIWAKTHHVTPSRHAILLFIRQNVSTDKRSRLATNITAEDFCAKKFGVISPIRVVFHQKTPEVASQILRKKKLQHNRAFLAATITQRDPVQTDKIATKSSDVYR